MSDIRAQLEALLAERILIIDGAMGTAIQRTPLEEANFRGERFANHPSPLKGEPAPPHHKSRFRNHQKQIRKSERPSLL